MDGVAALLERTHREEYGRVLASLIRDAHGDFDAAEEALAEAFARAVAAWRDAPPQSPGAWLLTTARRVLVDHARHSRMRAAKADGLAHRERRRRAEETVDPLHAAATREEDVYGDERLRLVFTCCHPALARNAQVALTLRTLGGLETSAIARAFLVPEPTMAQRLVRAKRKIRDARVPYRVPPVDEIPARLTAVLHVLYLVFNEGFSASVGDAAVRRELCDEAIRLTRTLHGLLPGEPEVGGLLALMLLHDARRSARQGTDGALVPLDEQDRTLWDADRIREGRELLERCLRVRRAGPYQVQAAISACHVDAARAEDTDWEQIARLYDVLLSLQPSPVVALNRAVAVSYAEGAERGLRALRAAARELPETYQPLHAAWADMLRRAGRRAEARTAYDRAIELAGNEADRAFLQRRRLL